MVQTSLQLLIRGDQALLSLFLPPPWDCWIPGLFSLSEALNELISKRASCIHPASAGG